MAGLRLAAAARLDWLSNVALDVWEGVSDRRRAGGAGGPTRDMLYAEARLLGIEGRGRMSKSELASAIRASTSPSPARVFRFSSRRLWPAAFLRQARRSHVLVIFIVVAALATALGGAMPILVYGIGQSVEEVNVPLRAHDSAGSSAPPLVGLSSSRAERARAGERTPALVLPATDSPSSFGEEVEGSRSAAASARPSGADVSEPPTDPGAASDQDDGSSAPISTEEEVEEADGAGSEEMLCHKPSAKKEGETITVSADAVSKHLAHGDTLGACLDQPSAAAGS